MSPNELRTCLDGGVNNVLPCLEAVVGVVGTSNGRACAEDDPEGGSIGAAFAAAAAISSEAVIFRI